MFLLKDTTQWRRWGSNPRPLGLESSTQPLSHCAPLALFQSQTRRPMISTKIVCAIPVCKAFGRDCNWNSEDLYTCYSQWSQRTIAHLVPLQELTWSFDHWILPIHLGAFLQAVLAPNVSSAVVSSYIPVFCILLSTSCHRFICAGVFCL